MSALMAAASPAAAQETNGWEWTIAPYLLAPHMSGEAAINGNLAEVDAGPGDIFDKLDFAAMIYIETANKDWAVIVDGIYMNLGETGQTPITGRAIEFDMKQFVLETTALRRVASWAEIGLGGRLVNVDAGLDIVPGEVLPGTLVAETNTWFDPFLAARLSVPLEGRLRLGVRGDFGGFGIGSDYAWQVYPVVGYRFTRVFELAFAYRALGMKYEKGSGDTLFLYDLVTYGPELGFLLHF